MLYDMEYPFGKFSAPAHSQSLGNQKVIHLEQALLKKTITSVRYQQLSHSKLKTQHCISYKE